MEKKTMYDRYMQNTAVLMGTARQEVRVFHASLWIDHKLDEEDAEGLARRLLEEEKKRILTQEQMKQLGKDTLRELMYNRGSE